MISTTIIKSASSLELSLYDHPSAVAVDWAKREDDPICWGVTKIDGIWYFGFRGSKSRNDWERDFEALAIWADDLKCHVHPGFYANGAIKTIVLTALAVIGDDDYVIFGHSLGAAEAAIAAVYCILLAKKRPLARIAWGEPRPGFSDLAQLLAEIPNYNFVNGGTVDYDRVTDVPFTLVFEWYCAGAPHLFVCEPPSPYNIDILFRWHNFVLYNAAMNKLPDEEM